MITATTAPISQTNKKQEINMQHDRFIYMIYISWNKEKKQGTETENKNLNDKSLPSARKPTVLVQKFNYGANIYKYLYSEKY